MLTIAQYQDYENTSRCPCFFWRKIGYLDIHVPSPFLEINRESNLIPILKSIVYQIDELSSNSSIKDLIFEMDSVSTQLTRVLPDF